MKRILLFLIVLLCVSSINVSATEIPVDKDQTSITGYVHPWWFITDYIADNQRYYCIFSVRYPYPDSCIFRVLVTAERHMKQLDKAIKLGVRVKVIGDHIMRLDPALSSDPILLIRPARIKLIKK